MQLIERNLRLEEVLVAQDEGIELRAGEVFGGGTTGGEVGREQKRGDAIQGKRAGCPVQNVERRGDHRGAGQGDAERKLVGAGVGGRGDVVELGRQRLTEDAVDLGAGGLDAGNDDGDLGGGLMGEAGA